MPVLIYISLIDQARGLWSICRIYLLSMSYVNMTALGALGIILRQKEYVSCKPGDYLVLRVASNRHLFYLLELAGFFRFHVTNTRKEIVGLHQVVAFVYHGYKAYLNGFVAEKGYVEVHHIDDNPLNNHPDNLTYLSPIENQLVAQAVGSVSCSRALNGFTVPFNRQGRPVSNPHHYLARIVRDSIEATYRALGVRVSIVEILLELPRDLGRVRVQWSPRFLINALRRMGYSYA